MSPHLGSVLLLIALSGSLWAAEANPVAAPAASGPSTGLASALAPTDPSYRLSAGDTVAIIVYNEGDLAISQTVGHGGEIRPYLIGEIYVAGKTVRETERVLEAAYRDRQFLKEPVVTVTVTSYSPREVSVLGAVRAPGTVMFPRDITSLDLVDVIARVGGFLPVSKTDAVTVSRRDGDGKEKSQTYNLDDVVSGRRRAGRDRSDVAIYPGDRIWVPERLF